MLKKDPNYEATRLHFENLAKRYGNPIIIWNLIKVDCEVILERNAFCLCVSLHLKERKVGVFLI